MRFDYVRIGLLALLFFIPFLGGVHLFDGNEIGFAESAREMLVTGEFCHPQMNFSPFWDNPPLFMWLQAVSMHFLGVSEFAARFPNAVAGLLTLLLAYHIGRRLHDRVFGWLWALAWLGSLLPHFYFRTGLSDPWFSLLVFSAIYGFIEFRWLFFTRFTGKNFWHRYRYILLGGWLLGLAILTKGLMALLIAVLTLVLYWARYRFRNKGFSSHLLLFSAAALSLPVLWLALGSFRHGAWFFQDFLSHHAHLFFRSYGDLPAHIGLQFLSLAIGCFPIALFAIPNLWGDRQPEDELLESDTLASCMRSDMATWMQRLFWVVVLLPILLGSSAGQYASLAYFPLTYLGSLTIWRAFHWEVKPRIVAALLPVMGVAIGLCELVLPILGQNQHWLRPLFSDNSYALAKLDIGVEWHWWQGLPGVVLIATSLLAWRLWRQSRPWWSAQTLFAGGAVFMSFSLLLCVRNVEHYVQRSTIDFYESKVGEDCFVEPVGFRSYGHLFYTRKTPRGLDCSRYDYHMLAHGDPGKKVYFVAKVNNPEELPHLPDCREIFRKDGHIFYQRVPH